MTAFVVAFAFEVPVFERMGLAIVYGLMAAICIRPSWEFLQRSISFLRGVRRRYALLILLVAFSGLLSAIKDPNKEKPSPGTSSEKQGRSSNPYVRLEQLKEREREPLERTGWGSSSKQKTIDDIHYEAYRRDMEQLGLDPDMQDEDDIRAFNKILRDKGLW